MSNILGSDTSVGVTDSVKATLPVQIYGETCAHVTYVNYTTVDSRLYVVYVEPKALEDRGKLQSLSASFFPSSSPYLLFLLFITFSGPCGFGKLDHSTPCFQYEYALKQCHNGHTIIVHVTCLFPVTPRGLVGNLLGAVPWQDSMTTDPQLASHQS